MVNSLKKYFQNLGLAKKEIDEIVSHFEPLTLKAGEHFFLKGKIPNTVPFIVEGVMRLHYIDENAKDITAYFLKENIFFPFAGLVKQPAEYNVQAITQCQLLVLKQAKFDVLLKKIPTFATIIDELVRQVLVEKTKPQYNFKTGTSKKRYEDFIHHHSDIALRVPLQYIASYIGITKQPLSRIRNQYIK